MVTPLFENRSEYIKIFQSANLSPTVHFHKSIELIYVIEGGGIAYADQKKYTVKTGDVFISFPNQIHYYLYSATGKYMVAIFSPDMLFEMREQLYNCLPESNVFNVKNIPNLENLLTQIVNFNGEYRETMEIALIGQIMASVMPCCQLKSRIKTNSSNLQLILNYCSSNFKDDITLENVAEAVHISKFHISHLINSKLGMNFNNYLNSIRINHACDLLNESNKKIADISEETGFGSIRSFNRAFKSVMNMTPAEYRNKGAK